MAFVTPSSAGETLVLFSEPEARLIHRLITDVQELMASRAGEEQAPADPALARLFPDVYRDDPAAAAEMRRLTEESLRLAKGEAAATVRDALPEQGGLVVLDPRAAESWLTALNDVRLVLGTRLDVTEETYEASADVDASLDFDKEPEKAARLVYHWLSLVQDQLVEAMRGN